MSRATRLVAIGSVLLVAVASAIWFVVDGDTTRSRRERQVRDPVTGVVISVPASWRAGVVLPEEGGGVRAANGPVTWGEENACTRDDRTHVDVSIVRLSDDAGSAQQRPTRFTPRSGTGLLREPLLPCGAHVQRIDFVSGGAAWSANLRFGGGASESDRLRAYGVLDSMQP